jgi:hypothetical protein
MGFSFNAAAAHQLTKPGQLFCSVCNATFTGIAATGIAATGIAATGIAATGIAAPGIAATGIAAVAGCFLC